MFSDFTVAVAQKLAAGSKVVNLSVTGDHIATIDDFTAHRVPLEVRSASN
jgi:hypothetical protein